MINVVLAAAPVVKPLQPTHIALDVTVDIIQN
jgi:hypothetical protein